MKILFTLSICLLSALTWAQQTQGTIVFEQKMNLHRQMKGDNESMKAMVPEFRTMRQQLLFTPEASLYKAIEEEEDEAEMEGGRGGIRMRFGASNDELYRDLVNRKRIEKREFMGTEYLLEDTLLTSPWKLATERKSVMGIDCMKATLSDTARHREITAWFAPTIAVPTGPDMYSSLPGMVLEVDINDGEIVIKAISADWKKPSEKALKAPKGGKQVTAEEFKQIMDEQLKKMGVPPGGGIRMIRN